MRRTIASLALAVTLLVAGCAVTSRDVVKTYTSDLVTTGETPAPALTRLSQRRAMAIGMLVYRRDEGGYFAVADILPDSDPDPSAKLIAILVQADGSRSGEDLAPMVGSYCRFEGRLRSTSATFTPEPVPEFVVESYRILEMP